MSSFRVPQSFLTPDPVLGDHKKITILKADFFALGAMVMATTLQPATETSAKQLVNYRVDGGIATIEMNDPPANTYTYEMNRQLDEAILKARMDNGVYVIVLTGAGDKFFSAGANIKML